MQLLERFSGLGKVLVTAEEDQNIRELSEIVSNDRIKCYLQFECEHVEKYQALMKNLFPELKIRDDTIGYDVGLHPFCRSNRSCAGPSYATEMVIDNRLPIGRTVGQQDVELRIIMPQKREDKEYSMTLALHMLYTIDCVDDIVDILGMREKPPIEEAQLIPTLKENSINTYGIADVPRLGTVIELYQRAATLAGNAYRVVGASLDQLNLLRRDAKEHENLAVRELSQKKYRTLLETLTEQ